MIALDVRLDGDGAFPELATSPYKLGSVTDVVAVKGGMHSGKPAVAIRVKSTDRKTNKPIELVGETSLALFLTAADALKARYGDPRE